MQDILDVIVSRRSAKKYKSDSVPQELVEKVVKAGSYAPSGMNRQSPIILAVTNREVRDKLSALNARLRGMPEGSDPFYGAPVALVVLADKSMFTYVYDGSVVIENMLLEAHSLGLGACWIHHGKQMFEDSEGKALLDSLGITGEYEGIGTCILGYPDCDLNRDIPRKENYIYYIK
jgi:nitroreductase